MKKIIVFLGFMLTGLLVVSSTGIPLQAAIPAEERAALIAFYNATNGDNWLYNWRWKTPPLHTDGFAMPGTENTWYGIAVSDDHVVSISMFSNFLSGNIPPELGNLSNLVWLGLNYNWLNGSIPPELGNLSKLEELWMSENELSGSIPPELGNLSNLEYLNLYSNQLSGSIPPELGNLSNLADLSLGDNQLSGSIPPELGNLGKLEDIGLSYNQLSGSIPPELGNLSNLEYLYMYSNQLSGSIPPELGNLSDLKTLNLGDNKLSGIIPTSLTNLTNLSGLYIRHNCLYTNDPDLRAWLNNFDPDWESYQCLPVDIPPFGAFETPVDGSTVCSSIAVTGWALDDFGVESVKIYREQGNDLVYIGDATFVEGARPDIAGNYPDYPNNTRAGWGYMMLTNFLPNSGNGTFVLHAIATDASGKTTTLGTKTIHCDNANACKPFGAIDTPTQGGDTSGNAYRNVGWVLTPWPNKVPENGSTIHVYVDGVKLGGHANYNIYREDIAALFPGYANSSGAQAYYDIDTTAYANGLHQIFWIVTDNAGNVDGIGSRYFSIQNTTGRKSMEQGAWSRGKGAACLEPVGIIKGYVRNVEPRMLYPDDNGMITIEIKELERIEVYLSDQPSTSYSYSGYMTVGNSLKALPVGSTLDAKKGIFYWQPGPGFLGSYHLVFVKITQNGAMMKKTITVEIIPETNK